MSSHKLPLLVLDWDRVILDCDTYLQTVFNALIAEGLPPAAVERLYHETKDHNGYSDVGLAAGAAMELGRDVVDMAEAIEKVTCRTSDFIYPDALRFLQAATHEGYECVVLTAGGEALQNKKILHSKLKKHFKDIHIVPVIDAAAHKKRVLQRLAESHDRLIFFDDKAGNLVPLAHIPNVTVVWVKRTGSSGDSDFRGVTMKELSFPLPRV